MSVDKRLAILILACALIETTAFALIADPSKFPHLSLIVLVFASLRFGDRFGVVCGVLLGLFWDMMGIHGFGTLTVCYGITGFLCGRLRTWVFMESVLTQWLLPGLVQLFLVLVFWFMIPQDVEESRVGVLFQLIWHSSIGLTVLASPFISAFLDRTLLRYSDR